MLIENLKSYPIVLADDDAADRELFFISFKKKGFSNHIYQVEDGEQLITLLLKSCQNPQELPCLILLDINMPRKNGFEALKEIKENVALAHLPVVIFSTSNDPADIKMAYQLGANAFVTKPNTFSELSKVVESLGKFWLNAAALPFQH